MSDDWTRLRHDLSVASSVDLYLVAPPKGADEVFGVPVADLKLNTWYRITMTWAWQAGFWETPRRSAMHAAYNARRRRRPR